jgi:hypothetical protein
VPLKTQRNLLVAAGLVADRREKLTPPNQMIAAFIPQTASVAD